MDFTIAQTSLEGVLVLQCRVAEDARGRFIKNFRESRFSELGLETHFPEQYVTTSGRDVLRGLHFQTPPHDHVKLVTCFSGEILDAVLDLRKGSATFGRHELFFASRRRRQVDFYSQGMRARISLALRSFDRTLPGVHGVRA